MTPRKPAPLTERDLDVLRYLAHLSARPGKAETYWRPMDIGGTDASHHSATLTKLAKRGFVEVDVFKAAWQVRGHKRYRISPAGGAELASRGRPAPLPAHG